MRLSHSCEFEFDEQTQDHSTNTEFKTELAHSEMELVSDLMTVKKQQV